MNVILVLALASAGIFTGCGVSQSEHQRVAKESQQVKQKSADASVELDAANQKNASLTNSIVAQDKTIQDLNDSVRTAEASNAEKEAEIDKLMNLEKSAFDDAEAAYKSGFMSKALTAYKAFVRDFPFSPKVEYAKNVIPDLKKLILAQEKKAKQQEALVEKVREIANTTYSSSYIYQDGTGRLSYSDIVGIAAYISNHPEKDIDAVVSDAITAKINKAVAAQAPVVSEPEPTHHYSISSERAEKYFSPAAHEEMRAYLEQHGQPTSESDIDFWLKFNELAEHYNGN